VVPAVLLGVLLVIFEAFLAAYMFVHGFYDAVGEMPMEALSELPNFLFASWYPLAVCGSVLLLLWGLIIKASKRRIRRAFAVLGLCQLISALICVVASPVLPLLLKTFPANFEGAFVAASGTMGDLFMVCAAAYAFFGVIFLSVYYSVKAVKGADHE